MQSDNAWEDFPLVAILRGVTPERVIEVADVVYAAGFKVIEVPLNSPEPFESIAALAAHAKPDCWVGAGTVLNPEDVRRTHAAGRLVVAPNVEPDVIGEAIRLRMQVLPGVATATEAFTALRAGARQLKLFPASSYGPRHLTALRSVLPREAGLLPVGGVAADQIADWLSAGAAGFGFGSELFRPEYRLDDIERRAHLLIRTFREARSRGAADSTTTMTGRTA